MIISTIYGNPYVFRLLCTLLLLGDKQNFDHVLLWKVALAYIHEGTFWLHSLLFKDDIKILVEIWYAVQIKCRFLVKKSQTIKIITSLSTKITHSKSMEFDQHLVFEPKTTDLSKSVICDLHSRNRRDWWKKDGVYNIQKCVLLLSTYKCLRHSGPMPQQFSLLQSMTAISIFTSQVQLVSRGLLNWSINLKLHTILCASYSMTGRIEH